MERLQKYIANCGYCSRIKAEELITQGKVFVNGNKITELDSSSIPENSFIVYTIKLDKTGYYTQSDNFVSRKDHTFNWATQMRFFFMSESTSRFI